MLANALRFNKTMVKLDLAKNALRSCVVKYLLEALFDNVCLVHVDLSGNFLDDSFARDLSIVLQHNPVLHTVDISSNPIGPAGGSALSNSLLKYNETLVSLGDLELNMYMGVRIREDLRQILQLNNTSLDNKKLHVK